MTENIKVSIIAPVYNVEKYLDKAIQSTINQTLKEIEIICVNDGSTDGCLDILKKYQKQDARIKIIDKDNTGYGHSMNLGIQQAIGEYIGILEPDDYLMPYMCEDLYIKAKAFDLDYIKGDYCDTFPGREIPQSTTMHNEKNYNRLINPQAEPIYDKSGNTWSGIYKKKFLKNWNIEYLETPGARYQDIGFYNKTLACASRIMYINKIYYMHACDRPEQSIKFKNKLDLYMMEYTKLTEWYQEHFPMPSAFKIKFRSMIESILWDLVTARGEYRKKVVKVAHLLCKEAFLKNEADYQYFPPNIAWHMVMTFLNNPEKVEKDPE